MNTVDKYLDVKLVESFRPMLNGMEKAFALNLRAYFNNKETSEILNLTWNKFEYAKKMLPNVGSQSPWLKNLIGITYEIGLWKELVKREIPIKSISILTQQTLGNIAFQQNTPEIVEKVSTMLCSQEYVYKIANYSHLEEYAEDWLFDCVVPSPSDDFHIGINISKCPIGSLCERLNADLFFPYLCLNDYVTHGMLGIELKRTKTLAHGADCCDFRLTQKQMPFQRVIFKPEETQEFNYCIEKKLNLG